MGSPTFGFPGSSNNAPLPIPGNTNPTGGNTGVGFGGVSFPNYPVFGVPNTGTAPLANAGIFSTDSGLSTLFNNPLSNYYNNPGFWNSVGKAYGKGTGQALEQLFGQLFNPQTAAAFLNSMQPAANREAANLTEAFGAEGSRFGSAASLGLGDYWSQVNLNEEQTLAQLYMNATNEEVGLLSNMLPTLHAERANSSGWIHDILGGLEIAGGIIGAPFTGGMSLGLVGAGVGQLGQGLGGGSGPNGPTGMTSPPIFGMPSSFNTGTFGASAPSWNDPMLETNWLSGNAASSLGGANNTSMLPPFMYGSI